jgi:hypothetical protein
LMHKARLQHGWSTVGINIHGVLCANFYVLCFSFTAYVYPVRLPSQVNTMILGQVKLHSLGYKV